jgi:hypothetical protein
VGSDGRPLEGAYGGFPCSGSRGRNPWRVSREAGHMEGSPALGPLERVTDRGSPRWRPLVGGTGGFTLDCVPCGGSDGECPEGGPFGSPPVVALKWDHGGSPVERGH